MIEWKPIETFADEEGARVILDHDDWSSPVFAERRVYREGDAEPIWYWHALDIVLSDISAEIEDPSHWAPFAPRVTP